MNLNYGYGYSKIESEVCPLRYVCQKNHEEINYEMDRLLHTKRTSSMLDGLKRQATYGFIVHPCITNFIYRILYGGR